MLWPKFLLNGSLTESGQMAVILDKLPDKLCPLVHPLPENVNGYAKSLEYSISFFIRFFRKSRLSRRIRRQSDDVV